MYYQENSNFLVDQVYIDYAISFLNQPNLEELALYCNMSVKEAYEFVIEFISLGFEESSDKKSRQFITQVRTSMVYQVAYGMQNYFRNQFENTACKK